MSLLKNVKMLIHSVTVLSLVMILGTVGCSDDDNDPPSISTDVAEVFELISAAEWKISELRIDNDISSTYTGLTLSFGEGTYTSTNGAGIFPASGTWVFPSTDAEQVVLDNDLEMDILEISETSLVLSLEWTKNTIGTGGKSESVSGNHVFSFTK
jgi:hypothetical protein